MITLLARIAEHLAGAWAWLRSRVLPAPLDAERVNAQLWTGAGIETAADVVWLKAHGVTADIDMREEFDDRPLTARTLTYLWAPETDDGVHDKAPDYLKVWAFAQPILAAGGVIYTHCAAGHNRGPSCAAFLLMAHWGMSADEARAAIQKVRPVATIAYLSDAATAAATLKQPQSQPPLDPQTLRRIP